MRLRTKFILTYVAGIMTGIVEEDFEMELESVSCECRPLRPYVRSTKEKGFVVNEENMRRLGAEMFLEYGLK